MDSSISSILAAQIIQDRMAEATSARARRDANAIRRADAEPRRARRWLRRSRSSQALASAPPR